MDTTAPLGEARDTERMYLREMEVLVGLSCEASPESVACTVADSWLGSGPWVLAWRYSHVISWL